MQRILVAILMLVAIAGPARGQDTVTIAVVRDGSTPSTDLRPEIESELRQLLPGRSIAFKESRSFDAQWTPGRYRQVVQAALDDPDVDIVLAMGALVSEAAAEMELDKQVVSAFPARLDFFDFADMEEDRSTKPNYSFMIVPQRAESDIRSFRGMISFDTATVVLGEEHYRAIQLIVSDLDAIEQRLEIDLEFVPVSTDIARALEALDPNTDAVLLGETQRLSAAQRQDLISGITDLKIPVFSFFGEKDVELGALAARTPDFTRQVVRRSALNLSELIRGTDINELPVVLTVEPTMFINGRTASAIGYTPNFMILSFAQLLYPDALATGEEPLQMSDAMRLAEEGNAALSVSTQQVQTMLKDKDIARSPMLPDIRFVPAYLSIDAGSRGLGDAIPDHQITLGVSVSQMIYDDRRISDFRSSSRMYESSEAELDADLLNTYRDAGDAFLRYVLARILYRVQLDNLRLTETNLELAKIRLDVGYSGRDEVYRWEAEVAKRSGQLLESQAEAESRRIALNQILGVDQETSWNPREIEVDPDVFPFVGGRLDYVFDDPASQTAFHEAIVAYAIQNAPELRAIMKGMEAQDIQLNQRTRRWFLPSFQASFNYDYRVAQDPDIVSLPKGIPRFFITADYPIFEGTRRANEVGRARSELNRLTNEQRLVHQMVEKRTRTALQRVQNSFPTIRFGEIQAENAQKNLILVQDKYGQGLVNVTDLMSAQNESFVAEQAQYATIYGFLLDLLNFERSISWFEEVSTQTKVDEFVQTIETRMSQQP